MPLKIVRDNIVNVCADAIVNSANPNPVIGSGVDFMIHKHAGEKLLEERKEIGCMEVGDARISNAYNLKAKYIIHTVGPKWIDGQHNEVNKLYSCYRNSLLLAHQYKCHSIAFPLISSGYYGIDKEVALKTATKAIRDFLQEYEMLIYLVVFDKKSYIVSKSISNDVESYINERYVEEVKLTAPRAYYSNARLEPIEFNDYSSKSSLEDLLDTLEDSFSESLFKWIIKKDLSDVHVYKKANMDRKLFSKIRNNKHYKPSKINAIALAIALELDLEETKDFIGKAGYALTHSSKFDIIIEYYISKKNYNIFDINEMLFKYDLPIIGG